MTTALGGLDALVFTGGVGERSARVRAASAALGFLGIGLAGRGIRVESREDVVVARAVRAATGSLSAA